MPLPTTSAPATANPVKGQSHENCREIFWQFDV
jgi:hypothetical protein